MPGTHLLPPNLLKLFAPRPPLPYTRPLDRDIDRVHLSSLLGVDVGSITGLIGKDCSPVSVVGVGAGSTCATQTVCCDGDSFVSRATHCEAWVLTKVQDGLVNLGCKSGNFAV